MFFQYLPSGFIMLYNAKKCVILLLLWSNYQQGLTAKRMNLWSILWSSKWFSIQPSKSARDQSRRLKEIYNPQGQQCYQLNNWIDEQKIWRKIKRNRGKENAPYAMRLSWRVLHFQRGKRKLCGSNPDMPFIFPFYLNCFYCLCLNRSLQNH